MMHMIPFAVQLNTNLANDKMVLDTWERGCQCQGFDVTYFYTGKNSCYFSGNEEDPFESVNIINNLKGEKKKPK